MKKSMLLLMALPLLFGSCVTSSVISNKSPDFDGKIERIYIIMKGADSANGFFNSFKNELTTHLKTKGVASEFKLMHPLSLETEEEMMEKIATFEPQYVMLVGQTESRSTTGGYGWSTNNIGGTFDIQLRDMSGEKILWRASLKADSSFGIETSAADAAKKLFDKMRMDGLFN